MNNCGLANDTIKAGDWIHYISKDIVLPAYLVIGTVCNALLLIAFYKQSKQEKPYVYQALLTASKTLEVIMLGIYFMGHDWFSGYFTKGADWFQKSYLIVFINYKLGTVLHMHFIVSSVLLATAMAADRAFCLIAPMRYKTINHKLHQFVAGLVCFTLPAITSISYAWFWTIPPAEQDRYVVVINTEFTESFIGQFCSQAGLGVRLISLATLIVLNVITVRAFGRRSKTLAKLRQDRLAAESKALEKNLMVLSVTQSVLICVNQIPNVVLYVMLDIAPNYTICHGTIIAPLSHLFIFLTDMVDVAVVIAVNKKMRRMVKRVIGCGSPQVGAGTTPAGNAGAAQAQAQAVTLRTVNRNNALHG